MVENKNWTQRDRPTQESAAPRKRQARGQNTSAPKKTPKANHARARQLKSKRRRKAGTKAPLHIERQSTGSTQTKTNPISIAAVCQRSRK
ncbi:hypothetical protein DSO57_1011447 [Entomophthora muscae]|uniref:Uncharacterized protein n=1 Tax=Entomophthora muscae TaxID=34485 RepID=A0ACC2RKY2_9FUNG|nr:hypothetical protein DSO57_1011447 [Entomophthora muscae]